MGQQRLVDPKTLRAHEDFDPDRARRVLGAIRKRGIFFPPVLIDDKSLVILDGHHRWWAGKHMGCEFIPCYCIDYLNSNEIEVYTRRSEIDVTKASVLEVGLSNTVYPLKTTRHVYTLPEDLHAYSLDELLPVDTDG